MKATVRQGLTLLLTLAMLAMSVSVQAERKLLDRVVAIVDDEVILQSELDARINTIIGRLSAQGTGLPPRQLLEQRVLEQLIQESLQLQLADQMGMRISDNELNETLASIARNNGMTLAEFEGQLAEEGVTYQQAREQIRNEMLTSRVQQRRVGNRVRITDREVQNYLQAQAANGSTDAEFRLAYIFIEVDDPGSEASVDQAREDAHALRQQIVDGRDFREVAVAESDASNALEGGDMGWRTESQLPSLVAPVVTSLEVGQPSEVLENNSGFHLVMVMDKRGGDQQLFVQQHRVRHILVRPSEAVTDAQAEQRIRDIYSELQDGADFADLARERSDDPVSGSDGGNLGWVSPGQMVPAFEEAMLQAQVGEYVGPFRSQFGWHILEVEERRQQDVTEENREAQARQAIYMRKFEQELQNWVREIRDEAFVEFKGQYAELNPEAEDADPS
ncbi:peptidylprolyl isomerase [Marinobacter daepoensis]|uniref:Chaperone SurA n=1 Tax=Marinobacter daepoensis TaxID=262077 RepID=A0ABS3BJB1_9GAMM|nr:peptidylprolyl isomerase [Marinobacter daepoensis]MBN7770315.1 peptidylprolyl isomerase [Marinobacter daepoensis]MBY6033845.1 peptidylprolyl isomerase [Marinobacter daepoensis]MBY6079761.1 peptidylprolyl isomerase [Marinobacter daepoensis]